LQTLLVPLSDVNSEIRCNRGKRYVSRQSGILVRVFRVDRIAIFLSILARLARRKTIKKFRPQKGKETGTFAIRHGRESGFGMARFALY